MRTRGCAVDMYENTEAVTLVMISDSDCSLCVEDFESVPDMLEHGPS